MSVRQQADLPDKKRVEAKISDPVAVQPQTDSAANRRQSRRLSPREVPWITTVVLELSDMKHAAALIDISTGGALIQTDAQIAHSAGGALVLCGAREEVHARGRVVRSNVSGIGHEGGLKYHSSFQFDQELCLDRDHVANRRAARTIGPNAAAPQRPKERRTSPRVGGPFDAACSRAPGPTRLRVTNISEGGCFVETAKSSTVGDRMSIKLSLPQGGYVSVTGQVVAADPGVGFALQFRDLNVGQLEELRQAVRQVLSRRRGPTPTVVGATEPFAADTRCETEVVMSRTGSGLPNTETVRGLEPAVDSPRGVGQARAGRQIERNTRSACSSDAMTKVGLDGIAESAPVCMAEIASDGRVLGVNIAGRELVGAGSLVELVGSDFHQLATPEERSQLRRLIDAACLGRPGSLEHTLVGLDGSRKRVLTRVVPRHRSSTQRSALAVTLDVTEHQRCQTALQEREQTLRETEARFDAVADANDCAVFIVQDGRIQYVNSVVAGMTGHRPEQLVSTNLSTIVPTDVEETLVQLERAQRGEPVALGAELRIQRADGGTTPLEMRTSPVEIDGCPAVLVTAVSPAQRTSDRQALADSAPEVDQLCAAVAAAYEERERLKEEWHAERQQLEAALQDARCQPAAADAWAAEREELQRAVQAAEERWQQLAEDWSAEREQMTKTLRNAQATQLARRSRSAGEQPPSAEESQVRAADRIQAGSDFRARVDGYPATLTDVSDSGAQVSVPTTLKRNQKVRLLLVGSERKVEVRASVVWVVLDRTGTSGRRSHRAGLAFIAPDSELINAVCGAHRAGRATSPEELPRSQADITGRQ